MHVTYIRFSIHMQTSRLTPLARDCMVSLVVGSVRCRILNGRPDLGILGQYSSFSMASARALVGVIGSKPLYRRSFGVTATTNQTALLILVRERCSNIAHISIFCPVGGQENGRMCLCCCQSVAVQYLGCSVHVRSPGFATV